MKKILYISNIAGSKASTNFFGTAMDAAKELNIAFYVVANRYASTASQINEDESRLGIHLCHADIARSPFSLSNIKAYKQICDIIKREKIDYIHCNTPVGGVLGRLAGKHCGVKKVIYQAHGFHFYKGAPLKNWLLFYPVERLLAHFTDAIITINQDDFQIAKSFRIRNKGKVYFVPGVGIDLSQYNCVNIDINEKRKSLNLNCDDVVIISAGELNENKNNRVLIKAMSKINNPKLHYLVCGKGSLEKELKTLVNKYNLKNKVHFLGYRTDIKELLLISDIFVMPSFREGLSRSIMEAMACGLPCVVSKIRGNIDLVDENGGYLCSPNDYQAFSRCIKQLTDNPFIRNVMGQYNIQKVNKFSVERVSNKITKIYKSQFWK